MRPTPAHPSKPALLPALTSLLVTPSGPTSRPIPFLPPEPSSKSLSQSGSDLQREITLDCSHDRLRRVRRDGTLNRHSRRFAQPIAVQGEAKMNKNELVSHVAAETSATRATAERMVGAVFSAIGDALARDEPVAIAGFGQFVIRDRAARQGRNPQTGEPVAIAASKVPSFKAAKALRDAVSG